MLRFFTILTILIFSYTSNAQLYVPFPTSADSAIWFETFQNNSGTYYSYELYLDGDTTFNGMTYTKIYRGGTYHAAIREANKVIYLRDVQNINLTTDTILYDFNVQVGDTLNWFAMESLPPIHVIATDSILVSGTFRKRFELNTMISNAHIIEGIGSTKGLLPYYIEFERTQDLNCFRLNGSIIWKDDLWNSSCYVSTEELKPTSKITINPNPANDYLNFTFETVEQRTLLIFNSLGQVVLNKILNNAAISLNIEQLPKGFYAIAIRTENGTFTKKIIKN